MKLWSREFHLLLDGRSDLLTQVFSVGCRFGKVNKFSFRSTPPTDELLRSSGLPQQKIRPMSRSSCVGFGGAYYTKFEQLC